MDATELKIDWKGDDALLAAAISAITHGVVRPSVEGLNSSKKISLFDYYDKIYLYGPVDNTSLVTSNNKSIRIFVETSTGSTYILTIHPNQTIWDLKHLIQDIEGTPVNNQRLTFVGRQLEDSAELSDYSITNESVLYLERRLWGGRDANPVLDSSSMDPRYDYDFTYLKDQNQVFTRGGEKYVRPCGWKRYAIKVSDKFDNLEWLGQNNSPGEWPVSYHGTGRHEATSRTFVMDGYDLSKGKGFTIEHGVYSTPDINVATKYVKEFLYRGDKYLVILQNRVNPTALIKIPAGQEYWISLSGKDIRPVWYLCSKKINIVSIIKNKLKYRPDY